MTPDVLSRNIQTLLQNPLSLIRKPTSFAMLVIQDKPQDVRFFGPRGDNDGIQLVVQNLEMRSGSNAVQAC
jgi:hypothetical protein